MKQFLTLIIALMILQSTSLFSEEARLLRYPNASSNAVTFSYGGDIYVVSRDGGVARRITSSEGVEIFPRFSPDGKTIAFSGEYDGNRELYTIPAEGGQPQRLTYSMDLPSVSERMGPNKVPMQWTSDGSKILYRSREHAWNVWIGRLFFVSKNGGLPEELPLEKSGFASLSPDGTKLVFNRIFREFRTWKRYRGGQAESLYIMDLKTKKIEKITNDPSQNTIPMWYGDKIYFISDRDHEMNIFCYDMKTKQTRKITTFDRYDVKFPSLGVDNITFENGGYIYLLDLKTEKYSKVTIQIAEDLPSVRPRIVKVTDKISNYEISPDGKRALFGARGDIFTVPAEKGNIRSLTHSVDIHERDSKWSPDGNWIAYISDKTGENEIYIMHPDGSEAVQLTKNTKSYLWKLEWSPDSKKLLCSDKLMRLFYLDVESKEIKEIIKSKNWEITDFTWSPDSRWIAFSDPVNNNNSVIQVYSLETGKILPVTDEFFDCGAPEFSADGKYLFFISNRTINPTIGENEWNFTLNNTSNIYGITLQKAEPSPFPFESDEAKITTESGDKDKSKDEKKDKKKKSKDDSDDKKEENLLKIDFDGIVGRIFELPIPAGSYYNLKSTKSAKLYYVKNVTGKGLRFMAFDFKERIESEVGEFHSYEISADEKKILFKSGMDYYISDLGAKVQPGKTKLDLSDMKVELDRKAEWKQVYEECWRQMRDFFYDPNMHGVDWKLMHDKYAELIPYVNHRYDLTYVIGELIGELNIGHAYVGGGDMPHVEAIPIGLLGADYVFEKGSYKIKRIFEGQNWDEATRSPLTEPGIDVKEGDYIVEIDNVLLNESMTPFKALVNKADKYVSIKVNSRPSLDGAKEYFVKTIVNETKLRYLNWVENNRRKVDQATQGKVAYIHIPDMGTDNGLKEFIKYFYPQDRKEALIVDDRYNGGGNVSPMIIERLRRVLAIATVARNQERVSTKPDALITGPMVLLLNELSASDGDLFPYQFKEMGLGKIIGKRSWGGVIGIRGSLPLLDGSYLNKPEFANFGADGKWVLEGVGMLPDIEVENDPSGEFYGEDAQLDRAIEEILKDMKTDKKLKIPQVPPYPIKK